MKKLLLKSLLLLCALIVGGTSSVWADDVTVTWNINGVNTAQTTSGGGQVDTSLKTSSIEPGGASGTWTAVSSTETSYASSNSGAQLGASSSRQFTGTITLSSTSIPETALIKSVTVTAKSNGTSTLSATVGGNSLGSSQTITGTTVTPYVITGSSQTGNAIVLTLSGTTESKYVTISKIEVTYTPPAGSVSAPTFNPTAGAVDVGTQISIVQDAADQIRYTTDGTDPTKTTGTVYSAPIAINTGTTFKAIAIKGENVSSVATAAYTINVTTPTSSPEGGKYISGTSVSIKSTGNTIYYTMTTDNSTPSTPTSSSTPYTTPIVLGVGTTKIKAIAYDGYNNPSSVMTRTFYVVAAPSPATLPFEATGTDGKSGLEARAGVVASISDDYAASSAPYRLKFDGVDKHVTIFTDVKPEAVSFIAKLPNATTTDAGTKMKVQGSADGVTFIDIQEFTLKGDVANSTFEFTTTNAFATTDRVVRLILTSKDQNVAVGAISISSASAIPVTITDADYAIVVPKQKVDFTDTGIKAYAAEVSSNQVVLTEIKKVAANTPVVVYKDVNATTTFDIPVTTAAADAIGTNNLIISDGSITSDDTYDIYGLAKKSEVVGFYHVKAGTKVPAGKCYVRIAKSSTAREFLGFAFDDEATGVNEMKAQKVDGQVYDLQGRKVANPAKGLYIVNGKKVVIK